MTNSQGSNCTMHAWRRRRVLSVVAAAACMPLLPNASPSARPIDPNLIRWRGRGLGAESTIALAHPDTGTLRRTLTDCVDEIRRLERVFSLFEPGSELCLLNRHGRLAAPSLDLRIVLAEAQRISALTDGAFDVTVQPLWELYSSHFRKRPNDAAGPPQSAIDRARGLVGYSMLEVSAGRAAFARPGMSATLNGIAQGYITDRIAMILRTEGFDRVLVDVGEIAACAPPSHAGSWQMAIADPRHAGRHAARIAVANEAVATSHGPATRFDRKGRHHHLFDPSTGRSATPRRAVSVIAENAMTADALSTALAISKITPVDALLRNSGAKRALIIDERGRCKWIGAA